jgi:hypothetical protein
MRSTLSFLERGWGRCRDTTYGGVIKLATIITLNTPYGATKLRGHKVKEVVECGKGVDLIAKWKGPRVVGVIIEDDKVILVTRDT